ncbi:MAG: hypothetical protein KIG88_01630 [Weeksellaceae bacterium]|nr:hypothetical protein [Weeksellaceae bacterium]
MKNQNNFVLVLKKIEYDYIMGNQDLQKKHKLTDILYSVDILNKLRWSKATLRRYEKKGLPFYRADEDDEKSMKMYLEEDVVNWLLRNRRGV